ncbi:hypothetical protein AHAS_Ahas18G0174500 [Arachis hypogaea]
MDSFINEFLSKIESPPIGREIEVLEDNTKPSDKREKVEIEKACEEVETTKDEPKEVDLALSKCGEVSLPKSPSNTTFKDGNSYGVSKALSRLVLPEVEARVSEKNILIQIHCEKHKGVLMYILKFIDKLHLSVLNTTSLPFGTSIVDITITAKVINISSPNTPGLRMLQGRKQLKDLVKKVQAARDEMQWGDEGPPPLLVKITPDLSKDDLEDIAAILSNTTISRPDTVSSNPLASEAGGLSGKPLLDLSTNILKQMYILTRGKIPLIGCGGISSGEDAYKKIRSGATLVQLYTAFAYGGPALIPQMKVAALVPKGELDGEMGDAHMAMQARPLSLSRSLIPSPTKMDRASVVGDVIEYIRELLRTRKKINCLLSVAKFLDELQLELHHVAGGHVGKYYSFLFNNKIIEGSSVYASAIANSVIDVMDTQYSAAVPHTGTY